MRKHIVDEVWDSHGLREVGERTSCGLGLQPAFVKARGFKPILSQRLAGGVCRVGKQQLLRSKQKAGCGVSSKRLERRTVSLNQCTKMVRRSWKAQNSLNGAKEGVTVMSVLLYASVVRIVVWDECSQSLLVGKLCRIGMA